MGENNQTIQKLIQCKMNKDKLDVSLLSSVSSAFKQYMADERRINLLIYDMIAQAFNVYRKQCLMQRLTFSLCLRPLCNIKDIRRLLLHYLIDAQELPKRLEDTIRFCHRQFVPKEIYLGPWENPDKVDPLTWFAKAMKSSQETSCLLQAFSFPPQAPFSQ